MTGGSSFLKSAESKRRSTSRLQKYLPNECPLSGPGAIHVEILTREEKPHFPVHGLDGQAVPAAVEGAAVYRECAESAGVTCADCA